MFRPCHATVSIAIALVRLVSTTPFSTLNLHRTNERKHPNEEAKRTPKVMLPLRGCRVAGWISTRATCCFCVLLPAAILALTTVTVKNDKSARVKLRPNVRGFRWVYFFGFPENVAKGSSGKSFLYLHLDTYTWILALVYLHLDTCTCLLALVYLHLDTCTTCTCILALVNLHLCTCTSVLALAYLHVYTLALVVVVTGDLQVKVTMC